MWQSPFYLTSGVGHQNSVQWYGKAYVIPVKDIKEDFRGTLSNLIHLTYYKMTRGKLSKYQEELFNYRLKNRYYYNPTKSGRYMYDYSYKYEFKEERIQEQLDVVDN